ncbi:MAG: DNA primase [bacterium]|nr:DNA primase [bacterium]
MTDTRTIKDRVDIVQLLGEYLPLKKAGANWKAPCPFHHEKSPSFMVHPEKQIWHCFGCAKGGDIFTFIQEMEGIDFPEALKLLADRAGVKLENNFKSEVNTSQRNRIYEINAKAAYFFHRFLLDIKTAEPARAYLARRGLKSETMEKWQIGFAPDQWELLTQYLLKQGFSIDDLVAAGLTIKKDNADVASGRGFYDRFRGRIMFPIWDTHGNVAGFTGRVLVETANSGGKYVNTPQSPVYDKSRIIYGLDKAKMAIKTKDQAVLVEGQMDVIACHQVGMENVVAASGTALTLEQIKILKRYSNNIAIAFDADAAGQNAAKRGIGIAMQEGMNIRVIRIPDGAGKDADECLKTNPTVWFDAVKNATEVMNWYFANILGKVNLKDPKQKRQAAADLLEEIAKIPYAVEKDEWLKRLGDKLDIDAAVLRVEAKKPKATTTIGTRTSVPNQPKTLTADNSGNVVSRIFSLFLKYPQLFAVNIGILHREYVEDAGYQTLYELLEKHYNKDGFDLDLLKADFGLPNGENTLDILQLQADKDYAELNLTEAGKEIAILIARVKRNWTKSRRDELRRELMFAEAAHDQAKSSALLAELQHLID